MNFVIFRYGWNYHYHFVKKELAKEFEGEFPFLGKDTEKYKTFPGPITRGVKRIIIKSR